MPNSDINVKSLHVYPIKSAAGIALSHAWLDELGLSFDRRFVISDLHGQFITARTEHKLCLIQVHLLANGLMLSAPNMDNLTIAYQDFSDDYQAVTVWGDTINAQHCRQQYDAWFSRYLNKPCQLLFFGDKSHRKVKNSEKEVGFADGYPLLLISQASLDDLNQKANTAFTMARFRPNIVVENCSAFAEDTWQRIRIGEVEFELAKACSRCTFTTVDPISAQKHAQGEPLRTLKTYRQVADGDIMFGQNLIALNQGNIHQGAQVEILSTKNALSFITPVTQSSSATTSKTSITSETENDMQSSTLKQAVVKQIPAKEEPVKTDKPKIDLSSWDKTVTGNNKETILAQAEAAGVFMPYSCREGMCGACKVQLDSGEVEQQVCDGLSDLEQQAGFILSCSCVPKSDIVISKIDRAKLRAIKEQERDLQEQRLAKAKQAE
ncbi:YcbX family protein [Thalassotalea sp. PLHSN55]|uniref:YcbX family protein n=1 Tax=Thalassotalea sp. PLHSN55 TaxID=3435888 RepID=UPI003F84911C